MAKGVTVSTLEDVHHAIKSVGFPLVFKPIDGNHGKGATINVKTEEEAIAAFEYAKELSLIHI